MRLYLSIKSSLGCSCWTVILQWIAYSLRVLIWRTVVYYVKVLLNQAFTCFFSAHTLFKSGKLLLVLWVSMLLLFSGSLFPSGYHLSVLLLPSLQRYFNFGMDLSTSSSMSVTLVTIMVLQNHISCYLEKSLNWQRISRQLCVAGGQTLL